MKKTIITRCLIGAPLGLAVSTIITILISVVVGDGNYYPVVPELITECGTEINAVLLQGICSLLYGAAWGGASVIWEQDEWSILRQSVTHLIVCSAATFPVVYFMHWMDHSVAGAIRYFSIFLGVYIVIWLSQYSAMKKKVEQLNQRVKEKNK